MKKLILILAIGVAFYSCKTEKSATATKSTEVKEEKCSTAISYTGSIKPILEENCVKCHSGSKPAHGIDLITYEGVVKATGHNLLCTITGGSCPQMPPMGAKLSNDQANKIDCWIKNGMKK